MEDHRCLYLPGTLFEARQDIAPMQYSELERIKKLLQKVPDTRKDLVFQLKSQITIQKTYVVDAEKVADGIIQHGLHIFGAPKTTTYHPP